MNLKKIEYTVDINGVIPANEQFAGTQGDHRVTGLIFTLSEKLYGSIQVPQDGKVMYRFDVYDGEGGVWSSDAVELTDDTVSLELEERHTRFGGKITVYLVITSLSEDNETEVELYSFPVKLRLNNKPEGIVQSGENYESITGLAEIARINADAAAESAMSAQVFANKSNEYAQNAKASENNSKSALVNINTAIKDSTDQAYSSTSENAQSGKAIAEALGGYVKKEKGDGYTKRVYAVGEVDGVYNDITIEVEDNDKFKTTTVYGKIPHRQTNGNLMTNEPVHELDCTNKKYVDDRYIIDQTYDPSSQNAQSGFAVYEAVTNGDASLDSKINTVDYKLSAFINNILPNTYYNKTEIDDISSTKQDTLVSGANVKTINGNSILGSGDITIEGGSGGTTNYPDLNNKPKINGVELSGNVSSADLGTTMSLVTPTLSYGARGPIGISDGIHITILNKITMNITTGNYFWQNLDFEIGRVSMLTFGQCTEEDFINGGYEIGKKYRIVVSDNNLIDLAQVVTTLEDKANITDTVPMIINTASIVEKAIYAQTPYLGTEGSSVVTTILCDRDDGYMQHTDDGGALFDSFIEFSKRVVARHSNGNLLSGLPQGKNEVANKKYVDVLVGDIETALDSIITMQNELIGGESE